MEILRELLDQNQFGLGTLFGFVLGILGNFVAWYLVARVLVPKFDFCPEISATPRAISPFDRTGISYRFKVQNTGSRSAIDVEVCARLRIKGLGRFPDTTKLIYIPLGDGTEKFLRIPLVKKGSTGARIFRIHPNRIHTEDRPFFPGPIRKRIEKQTLLLEDLLRLKDATIQLVVFAYDSFSGSRQVFESKRYRISDIKNGPFKKGALEVALTPPSESKRTPDRGANNPLNADARQKQPRAG